MLIDKDTGELFVFPGPYSPRLKSGLDYSNKFIDVKEEIPPYAVDIKTGDLLNKSRDPIIRVVGKKDIHEYIQSFKDEVDIYKILEKVAVSGDSSFLNRSVGSFGDFVNLPDNLNDFNDYVKKVFNDNSKIDKTILDAALNTALSKDALAAIIAKHVDSVLANSVKDTKDIKTNKEVSE